MLLLTHIIKRNFIFSPTLKDVNSSFTYKGNDNLMIFAFFVTEG